MSSRIDHERGCVVITVPGAESGYEVGRTFWPIGMAPESESSRGAADALLAALESRSESLVEELAGSSI